SFFLHQGQVTIQQGRAGKAGKGLNTGSSLAGLQCLFRAEIVPAAARMAVDHREGRLLLRQMDEDRDLGQVFDDIGEVSSVIAVTVIHRLFVSPSRLRIAGAATATSPTSVLAHARGRQGGTRARHSIRTVSPT